MLALEPTIFEFGSFHLSTATNRDVCVDVHSQTPILWFSSFIASPKKYGYY